MGWSRGSELMEALIDAFNDSMGDADIPKSSIVDFWIAAIAAFEELDWDTEYEVEGKDPLWDEAYSKSNSTEVD